MRSAESPEAGINRVQSGEVVRIESISTQRAESGGSEALVLRTESVLPSNSILILNGEHAGKEILANLVPSSDDINLVAGALKVVEMKGHQISNEDDIYDKVAVLAHQHCVTAGVAALSPAGPQSLASDAEEVANEGLKILGSSIVRYGAVAILLLGSPFRMREFEEFLPVPVLQIAGSEQALREAAVEELHVDILEIKLDDSMSRASSDASGIKEDTLVPQIRRILLKGSSFREDVDIWALSEFMSGFQNTFKELAEEDCLELCRGMRHRFIAPGDSVYNEGDVEQWAYIVVGGTVQIEVVNSRGESMPDLRRRIEPSQMFGEAALLKDEPRSNAALAQGWGADVMILDRAAFRVAQKAQKLRQVLMVLEKLPDSRTEEELKHLLLFLGDTAEAFDFFPQLAKTPQFFREYPLEVRLELANCLTLKRYKVGEQLTVKGESADAFCILMSGQALTSEGKTLTEGMAWGLSEMQQRGAKWLRTRVAETEVAVAELSRHEFWKVTKGRDEAEWQRRYELMRLKLHIEVDMESDFLLAFKTFAILRYSPGRTIARQGHSLVRISNPDAIDQDPAGMQIHRVASSQVFQAGSGPAVRNPLRTTAHGVTRGEVHLDFVLKGQVQFLRKCQFVKKKEAIARGSMIVGESDEFELDPSRALLKVQDINSASDPGQVSKELNVLELALGDCLTAPDLFGGQDDWTCSVIATTEVVIISIPLKELRALISNDRLREMQRIAIAHNRTRNSALQGLLRCSTEMNLEPVADDKQLFQKMGLPVTLLGRKPGVHLALNTKQASTARAGEGSRPHTARAVMTDGYEGGKTSYRLTQSRRADYVQKLHEPENVATEQAKKSYLPVSRLETPNTIRRLEQLSQPLDFKRARAVSNRQFQSVMTHDQAENHFKGAAWCNKEMPRYHGAVMAMKRKVRKGENPSFCPWTLRHGVVFALPQVQFPFSKQCLNSCNQNRHWPTQNGLRDSSTAAVEGSRAP